MRGLKFKGSISDGDWVSVPGSWKPGELIQPSSVTNLTTGSEVSAVIPFSIRIGRGCSWLIFVAFLVGLVALAGFLVVELVK